MEFLKQIGLAAALAIIFIPSQSTQEFLHHLVGQRLILRTIQGHRTWKARECDVAVEVTAVALDKSSIRLEVRNIGTPNVVNKNGTIEGCANVDVFSFQVNGFDMDQPRDQGRKVLGLSYRRQPAHDGDHAVGIKVPFEFSFKGY